MGCGGSSAPQVSPANRKKTKENVQPEAETENQEDSNQDEDEDPNYIKRVEEINKILRESVDFIIKCIARLPKPEKVHPIVCLTEYTSPLAISVISLTTGNTTEINLPIAALSINKGKHIILLGQIDMLSCFDTSNPDACAFLENSIRWTGGFGRNKYVVLILGLDKNEAANLAKIIQSFDFAATILDTLPDDPDNKPLPYHTIITTMQIRNYNRLRTFRGGLIIGIKNNANNQSKNPNNDNKNQLQLNLNPEMTKFMLDNGFGIPTFSLEVGNAHSDSFKTCKGFKEMKDLTFFNLIKQYKILTTEFEELSLTSYDNLVTTLRYHVITLPRKTNWHLLKLGKLAYKLLKNTNYIVDPDIPKSNEKSNEDSNDEMSDRNNDNTENSYDPFQCTNSLEALENSNITNIYPEDNRILICPSMAHCITVVLLTEIVQRLPPKDFQDQHFGKLFPGEIDDDLVKLNLADFKTHHEIVCESWSSTGLYLPSGVVAQATIPKKTIISMNNKVKLSIQVGCHTACTLSQKGPWRRWPIITNNFEFPTRSELFEYQQSLSQAASNKKDTSENEENDLFVMNDDDVTIFFSSPFGGIVYVAVDQFLLDKPVEIEVIFSNLLQYPVFSSSDPSIYYDFMTSINQYNSPTKIGANPSFSEGLDKVNPTESSSKVLSKSNKFTNSRSSHAQLPFPLSKNHSTATSVTSVASITSMISCESPVLCPWTEIETQFIEIAVPSTKIELFGDLGKYCSFIDEILSVLLQFTLDESQRTYRLVFDIELPNDKPVCDYPISMPMRMISKIAQQNPTSELLYLLYYTACLSIYQMNFAKCDCESIAMVAAFHTFIEFFKNDYKTINPMEYMNDTPPLLFSELWTIYTQSGSECFINSISDIRQKFEMRPIFDDKKIWALFVAKISQYSGKHYNEKLIQKKEEISGEGSLLTSSSRSLLQFQLGDMNNKKDDGSLIALPTLDE